MSLWSVAGGRKQRAATPQSPPSTSNSSTSTAAGTAVGAAHQAAAASLLSASSQSSAAAASSTTTTLVRQADASTTSSLRTHAVLTLPEARRDALTANDGAKLRSLRVAHNCAIVIDATSRLHVQGAPDDVERCIAILDRVTGERMRFEPSRCAVAVCCRAAAAHRRRRPHPHSLLARLCERFRFCARWSAPRRGAQMRLRRAQRSTSGERNAFVASCCVSRALTALHLLHRMSSLSTQQRATSQMPCSPQISPRPCSVRPSLRRLRLHPLLLVMLLLLQVRRRRRRRQPSQEAPSRRRRRRLRRRPRQPRVLHLEHRSRRRRRRRRRAQRPVRLH